MEAGVHGCGQRGRGGRRGREPVADLVGDLGRRQRPLVRMPGEVVVQVRRPVLRGQPPVPAEPVVVVHGTPAGEGEGDGLADRDDGVGGIEVGRTNPHLLAAAADPANGDPTFGEDREHIDQLGRGMVRHHRQRLQPVGRRRRGVPELGGRGVVEHVDPAAPDAAVTGRRDGVGGLLRVRPHLGTQPRPALRSRARTGATADSPASTTWGTPVVAIRRNAASGMRDNRSWWHQTRSNSAGSRSSTVVCSVMSEAQSAIGGAPLLVPMVTASPWSRNHSATSNVTVSDPPMARKWFVSISTRKGAFGSCPAAHS